MAKNLILVRHAKSSWKDGSLRDIDRPLNKRGKRDGPVMAAYIHGRVTRPELVLCSDSKRTRRTLQFIRDAFGLSGDRIRYEHAIYEASPAALIRVFSAVDDDVRSIMLVGHNPGLTLLHNSLVPKQAVMNIPTLGVAEFELAIDSWTELADSCLAVRLHYYYPKGIAAS